jgi:hypothetical protein
MYTVEFLAKHDQEEDLSDPDAPWWPEWHEYEIAGNGIPEFGRNSADAYCFPLEQTQTLIGLQCTQTM